MVQMTGNYPLDIGGPATVAYYIAYNLALRNVEVSMLIRIKEQNELKELRKTSEFQILEEKINIIPVTMKYDFKNMVNIPAVLYKIYKVTRDFNPEKYDIIHYNSPPVDITLLYPLKSKGKTKQTIAIHGGLFYESGNFIGRSIMRRYSNLFQRVIALNEFSKKLALKAGFVESIIEKIPNGVDIDYFNKVNKISLDGDPSLVYAGRLTKVKGVDILLEAFHLFLKTHPKAHLYVIGNGKERAYLAKLVERLNLSENVTFTGFIPSIRKVHEFIKSADIFVLPSYMENFSISLLEAMASKTPIIASDAEGNLEVLVGKTALFFRRGDSRDLAEKIRVLAEDEEYRSKLAEEAYNLAIKEYSWDVVTNRYLQVFQNLVGESR